MKITKRQLKRIIKEEKTKILSEQHSGVERAIGSYFDVRMMESLTSLLDDMFHNAMEAAAEDGLHAAEAYEVILEGIRKLVEEELTEMRY